MLSTTNTGVGCSVISDLCRRANRCPTTRPLDGSSLPPMKWLVWNTTEHERARVNHCARRSAAYEVGVLQRESSVVRIGNVALGSDGLPQGGGIIARTIGA